MQKLREKKRREMRTKRGTRSYRYRRTNGTLLGTCHSWFSLVHYIIMREGAGGFLGLKYVETGEVILFFFFFLFLLCLLVCLIFLVRIERLCNFLCNGKLSRFFYTYSMRLKFTKTRLWEIDSEFVGFIWKKMDWI